jgi:hypothetical protein
LSTWADGTVVISALTVNTNALLQMMNLSGISAGTNEGSQTLTVTTGLSNRIGPL